jgi:hypothetical protein
LFFSILLWGITLLFSAPWTERNTTLLMPIALAEIKSGQKNLSTSEICGGLSKNSTST